MFEVFLNIYESRNASSPQNLFYRGLVLLDDFEEAVYEWICKCKVEAVSFVRAFKNQRKIDVQLTPSKTITLRNKSIRRISRAHINTDLNNYVIQSSRFAGTRDINNHTPPLEWGDLLEVEETLLTSSYSQAERILRNRKRQKLYVYFKGRVKINYSGNPPPSSERYKLVLRLIYNRGLGSFGGMQTTGFGELDIDNRQAFYDFTIEGWTPNEVLPNRDVGFNMEVLNLDFANTTSYIPDIRFEWDIENTVFELRTLTPFPASPCKGLMLHEAFEQIVANYSEDSVAFKSDFLKNNCPKTSFLTNGLLLRQAPNADFFANFEDLFNDTQKIFNVGLEVNEKEVRIEEMPYFFLDEPLIQFNSPRSLKIKNAREYFFSDIKVGYEKWKDSSVGVANSIDEYNSKRQYKTGLKKIEKTLDLIVKKIITSGYLIEYTRRLVEDNTQTGPYDNHLFLIELTHDLLRSAQRENIGGISHVIDESTVNNLIYTPLRMLRRWLNYISGMVHKGLARNLIFASGEGNYQMSSLGQNACYFLTNIAENENVGISKDKTLFANEIISFEHQLRFQEFQLIRRNSRKYIEVDAKKGYLLSMGFKPNEGLVNFDLLRKND